MNKYFLSLMSILIVFQSFKVADEIFHKPESDKRSYVIIESDIEEVVIEEETVVEKKELNFDQLFQNASLENGKKIAFVQIAGLVARRIICDVDIGSHLKSGDIFGIIRFGSRVDIYFPSEASTKVLVGQKMIAGETIIADFTKSSKPVTRNTDEK